MTEIPADPAELADPFDPAKLAAQFKAFAAEHGGSATAVIAYLGRRGVRIVVVSADGPFTDAVVASIENAEAVCAAAGIETGEWDRELTGRITLTPADRRLMAGTGR